MTMGITWQEETEARLKEARLKENEFTQTSKRALVEAGKWKEIGDALEKVLILFRQRNVNVHQFVDYESLRQKTTWDNLKEITLANNGILSVIDAVSLLVKAEVFKDRESARNTIYSTIYHHKRDLKKVRKGVYKLFEREHTTKKHYQRGKTTGVSEIIKELKGQNNLLTQEQVLSKLIENNFDFQGKNPKSSVRMAWARLGYYPKKERQQLLSPVFKNG